MSWRSGETTARKVKRMTDRWSGIVVEQDMHFELKLTVRSYKYTTLRAMVFKLLFKTRLYRHHNPFSHVTVPLLARGGVGRGEL